MAAALHGPGEMRKVTEPIDLELRLRPPSVSSCCRDSLLANPSKLVAQESEQPTIGANASAPLLVQPLRALPSAARRVLRPTRRKANPHPAAARHGAPSASWLSTKLLPRHDLPKDLPLRFVGEKLLQKSDVSSRQARFLIPSYASDRIRALLSAEEIEACGVDSTDRTARREELGHDGRKKRASPTRYVGVPVSVYGHGGEWEVSELRLNKFHRSDGTVINGRGYMQFVGRCGFLAGDRVEVWAFRRPPQHLCFVIAKRMASYQAPAAGA